VEAAILRYVWIGEHQAAAAALWSAATYHVDRFDVAPILMVSSPVKRCGKTTLGRVLAAMLPRVLAASSITPAALFRTIEQAKPTLLIDEADAFLAGSEELRGLLNAGHTRDTAYVIRTVGDDHEPRQFCVFGAKLLLGIGRLAPTIEDRSIILSLERKPPGAGVARLTRQALADLRQIGQRLMRWAVDHGEQIDPDADPATPDALNDRQADCWRPLLHLAELAGGDWPARARAAAVALSAGSDADQAAGRPADGLRCGWPRQHPHDRATRRTVPDRGRPLGHTEQGPACYPPQAGSAAGRVRHPAPAP
jgi:putative DNA primase/helicase